MSEGEDGNSVGVEKLNQSWLEGGEGFWKRLARSGGWLELWRRFAVVVLLLLVVVVVVLGEPALWWAEVCSHPQSQGQNKVG